MLIAYEVYYVVYYLSNSKATALFRRFF